MRSILHRGFLVLHSEQVRRQDEAALLIRYYSSRGNDRLGCSDFRIPNVGYRRVLKMKRRMVQPEGRNNCTGK